MAGKEINMYGMNSLRKPMIAGLLLLNILLMQTIAMTKAAAGQNDIVLGMSTALTGPAADLGKNMLDGVQAGFNRVNREGGIKGRQVRIIALDDGYEPHRTAPNMRRLTEQENVLAVIGNVGTPTAIAAIPIANENKTLLFAAYTGAGVLRRLPPDRYVVNYRASYAEETGAMVDALINEAGIKPEQIAFFTQRDGYGDAGFVGGISALKRHGLKSEYSIVHTRYERNTEAVENSVADILLAKETPRAIIMVGAYEPCAKFIRLAQANGIDALFLNVSFVGSAPLAKKLGNDIENVIVTQVVPHPNDTSVKVVRQYRQDLKAMNPEAVPTFGGMEGYIASQIFTKALLSLTEAPNRENIIDALESFGAFDIGSGADLNLDEHHHQASHRIWPTVLKHGQFESFSWKDIKQLLLAHENR